MNNEIFSLKGRKVWVAGHRGMAGAAILERLGSEGCELPTVGRGELDLRRQVEVEEWMEKTRPDVVVVAAATVGGILANSTRPAEFLYDNLAISANIIQTAYRIGVAKLLFLGSSCIYPRLAAPPVPEEALLTGPLEPTNEAYAIAKIAGIKLCQSYRKQYGSDFISVMPTNLFGPGDRYDLTQGHVVAALIMKMHTAKVEGAKNVEIWGSGKPLREFLYSGDLADGCVFLLKHYSGESHVNLGTGQETTIRELAEAIAQTVGFTGGMVFDASKPDGAPRKVMDVNRLTAMGWKAKTSLKDGLQEAYSWFLANKASHISR
jgi:GDP-L-fucose synthase